MVGIAREELAALLRNLRSDGSFSTRRTAPVDDLALEVKGVGDIRLPVIAAQAKELRLVGRPAKFGHGERTIVDRRVRDTWEIPRSRVRIDNRRWIRTLRPILDAIAADLGLPPTASFDAQLHSMLLYEPGQFFSAHQDSEKTDQMIATLVVMLPSRSSGGDLVVEHRGESVRYQSSASALTFVAFYADTRHEVLPVDTGYRVALTYNLLLPGDTSPALGDTAALAATTAGLFERHYTQSPEPRWHGDRQALEPADRLVVLLDHQYTERGLRWSHLKGDDATRANILRQACEHADCELALAQAEIHETRECHDDTPARWRRRGWSDRDDDPNDPPDTDRTVGDILDATVTITPAAGEPSRFDGEVSDAELAEVTPTVELTPYDTEYTGYMGNYGNTMDRWYRRAAIVIWPRARAFAIRAKGDPDGTLDDLLALTTIDEPSRSARADHVATLLRFWPDAVRRGDQHRLLPGALRLATELGDEDLASRLLEPFAIEAITPSDATLLVTLAGQHGNAWIERQLSSWLHQRHPTTTNPLPPRATWVSSIPALCTNLRDNDQHTPTALGTGIARSLLNHLTDWLIGDVRQAALITTPSRRHTSLAALADPTLAVLRATAMTDPARQRDRIIGAVCDPQLGTIPMLVDVVQASTALSSSERDEIGVNAIARHCVNVLAGVLAQPSRAPDDWAITDFEPGTCCSDCTTLDAFLTDRNARELNWPLAKPRRQHIHHRIDEAELPVTHHTTRQGSPHKLVLTKCPDLHTRETDRTQAAKESLAIVQRFLTLSQ